MEWTETDATFIRSQRVAHLATLGGEGEPHVVPVCFAFDGESFYTAVDQKPKRVAPERLRRIRNLVQEPRVALLLDTYHEDWSRLRYLLVHGRAELVEGAEHRRKASRLLRDKYTQYRDLDLAESGRPIVRVRPTRVHRWQASDEGHEGTPSGTGPPKGGG